MILLPSQYLKPVFVGVAATTMYLMRAHLHPQMSPTWFCAWGWFFTMLRATLSHEMPWSWHAVWIALIPGLWLPIHPGDSLGHFLGWTTSILALRVCAVYPLYVLYWIHGSTSNTFPFNLFGPGWRRSQPLWYPVEKRSQSGDTNALCEVCREFTSHSSLIMGSRFPITKLAEWHRGWASFEKLRDSAENRNDSCHVCKLVWYSISEARRNEIEREINSIPGNESRSSPRTITAQENTPLIQRQVAAGLKIKVWQERPLTIFIYVQLFLNEAEVGARLLVHRNELSSEGE